MFNVPAGGLLQLVTSGNFISNGHWALLRGTDKNIEKVFDTTSKKKPDSARDAGVKAVRQLMAEAKKTTPKDAPFFVPEATRDPALDADLAGSKARPYVAMKTEQGWVAFDALYYDNFELCAFTRGRRDVELDSRRLHILFKLWRGAFFTRRLGLPLLPILFKKSLRRFLTFNSFFQLSIKMIQCLLLKLG